MNMLLEFAKEGIKMKLSERKRFISMTIEKSQE